MTYLSAHIAINFSGASSEQLLVSHRTQNASFVTRCDETGTTGEDRASQSQPGYTDATHLVIRKRSSVSSAATAASEELSSPDRLQQLLWRHRPPSDREQHDDIHDSDHTGQRGSRRASARAVLVIHFLSQVLSCITLDIRFLHLDIRF